MVSWSRLPETRVLISLLSSVAAHGKDEKLKSALMVSFYPLLISFVSQSCSRKQTQLECTVKPRLRVDGRLRRE